MNFGDFLFPLFCTYYSILFKESQLAFCTNFAVCFCTFCRLIGESQLLGISFSLPFTIYSIAHFELFVNRFLKIFLLSFCELIKRFNYCESVNDATDRNVKEILRLRHEPVVLFILLLYMRLSQCL
jgi:hypothetical protein